MERISDSALIGEVKKRLDENRRSLKDLRALTKKLESVNTKLKESEALKSNFLSNIRNEINNPLTAIMGLSEQMGHGDIALDRLPQMALLIFHEAFELDFQLKNIFMAAELEAGETSLVIAKIDVPSFVQNLVSTFNHKADAKNISVEYECKSILEGAKSVTFHTDPERLQVILSNLLANAIEYSLDNQKIFIKSWVADDMLFISVEDRGVGIEGQYQSDIFDRFRQLSSGARKSHKGHGLGLSVVKAILDILGGRVELSSLVGEGTTFTISIPKSPTTMGDEIFSKDGNEFIFDSDFDEDGQVETF